jgi:hypothetical protein
VSLTLQGFDDSQTLAFQSALEEAFNTHIFTIQWTQQAYSDSFYHNQIFLSDVTVQNNGPSATTGSDVSSAISIPNSFVAMVAAFLFVML